MKYSFITLKNKIIEDNLCTSCGACKGVCPQKVITFVDRENTCQPTLTGKCIECGMCFKSCVAGGLNFEELGKFQKRLQGEKRNDDDVSYFLCHSTDNLIWKNSASGGFVTSALLYALKKEIVKYAIVVTNDPDKPWLPKPIVANSCEDIIDAMQSKYCVVPTLEVLQDIKDLKAPVAIVLLPCQAQAFMNIRKQFPHLFNNVVFTIGLMCGNSLPFKATEDVLDHIGINNIKDIVDLKYRDGLWHGDLHVRLKDGTEKGIPYVKYMRYMGDFYRKQRCKMCVDGDAIFTDISSGDGWLPSKKQDNVYGWSIVHTHTRVGEELMDMLNNEKQVEVLNITKQEALEMKHMYRRHYSSIPRIEYKRQRNYPVPDYQGLQFPLSIISRKALVKKRIVDFCQSVLFASFTRKAIRILPLSFKSAFLECILKLWFKEK